MNQLDSKYVVIRNERECQECKKIHPPGTNMKCFMDRFDKSDHILYKRAYICLDCEKYFKRRGPEIKFE